MGRILAGALFLAACGDNGTEITPPNPPGGVDTTQPGGNGVPTPLYTPQVCGELSWTVSGGNGAIDVAVVPRSSGAQVLSVPLTGGAITGYSLDKDMNMQQVAPALTYDAGFTQVSASIVRDHLIATGVSSSSIKISAIANDLSTAQQLAKIEPGLVAKPTFHLADGNLIVPVADAQGLRVEQFDTGWNDTTIRVADTEPALAMTATQMSSATVAAWSTASSCHMMTLFSAAPGPLVTVPEACMAPAMAIDPATQKGALFFEGTDGLRMLDWSHTNVVGVSQLVRANGSAPRAVFDGTRIWMSHLDDRGDIVVGYFDGGHYTSAAVTGTHPASSAYDLVLINGEVWTVSFEADTYEAHRLCILPANG